jgi:hypothetical protein
MKKSTCTGKDILFFHTKFQVQTQFHTRDTKLKNSVLVIEWSN